MLCRSCGAILDASASAHGTIRCACGADNEVEAPLAAEQSEGGPYRAGATGRTYEAGMIACPSCGAPCGSEARACPHCEVELAAVRCPQCFALHFAGSKFCARCGVELSPEPVLDPTSAKCPRCGKWLARGSDGGVAECVGCGGLFVDHAEFAKLAAQKEKEASPVPPKHRAAHASSPESEVHYVKCPACAEVMNRVNFGKRSGVIVDVCRAHGTWFDAGELTSVLEWIARGGLTAAREREAEEAREEAHSQRLSSAQAQVAAARVGSHDLGSGLRSNDTFVDMLWSFLTHHDD